MDGDSVHAWATAGLVLCAVLYPFAIQRTRLLRQREWMQRARTYLTERFSLLRLCRCGEGWDNESGRRIMACVWIFYLGLTSLAFVYEGRVAGAASLLVMCSGMALLLSTRQPVARLVLLARIAILHQIFTLYMHGHLMPLIGMRRAVTVRAVCMLINIESLEEAFLHLAAYSLVIWDVSARTTTTMTTSAPLLPPVSLITLPLQMFVLGVLPMHVLGVSEWASASVKSSIFTFETVSVFFRGLGFFSCLVSVHVVFGAYMHHADSHAPLGVGLAFLGGGLVTLCFPGLAVAVDHWIAPNATTTTVVKKPARSPRGGCGVGTGRYHRDYARGSAWSALGLGLWALSYHVAFLIFITVRIVNVLLLDVPYSKAQSRILLIIGAPLVLLSWACYNDDDANNNNNNNNSCNAAWLSSNLTFLGLMSSFLCLLNACSRELTFANIARENEAEAFLSHAIKQKFASVGAAVEQLLLTRLDENSPLLRSVMIECRLGHARCFASGVFRKLEQGEQRSANKRTFDSLYDQVRTTTMASTLITEATQMDDASPWLVEMDWEIVHLVLTDLARTGRTLKQVWCRTVAATTSASDDEDDGELMGEVVAQLDKPVKRANRMLQGLLEELNGQLVVHGDDDEHESRSMCVFPVRMRRSGASAAAVAAGSSPTSTSSPLSSSAAAHSTPRVSARYLVARGGSHEVLSTLRFALVDDNALIRKNFERLLRNNLGVPQTNIFSFGQTYAECQRFPHFIQDSVDIAIFDQNLDFDDDDGEDEDGDGGGEDSGRRMMCRRRFLKGSDLAERAKLLGFSGCLVLHSSDVDLPRILEQGGVFHGAVEKSASSSTFVEGLASSWDSYLRQQQQMKQQ